MLHYHVTNQFMSIHPRHPHVGEQNIETIRFADRHEGTRLSEKTGLRSSRSAPELASPKMVQRAYRGLKVISIGEPFRSGIVPGYFGR
jgi:hypothetical protein